MTGRGITDGRSPSGGKWGVNEVAHINVLELKAIKIGVTTYCKNNEFSHVRVMSDNTTSISYINNKGGIKSKDLNALAKDIWLWCSNRNLWISAAHIPGLDNYVADSMSRKFNDAIEWQLNPKFFTDITYQFGT